MTPRHAGLPVLTYHAIDDREGVTVTTPGRFAATLAALLDSGHRPVCLADWIARGRPDEPLGFAIAFDDGLRSILRVANMLITARIPATVFLVTGRVGTDNAWPGQPAGVAIEPLLSWSEIRDLAALGFSFGAHGVTHAPWNRLNAGQLASEIAGSRASIEDHLGKSCRIAAYPYGVSNRAVRLASAQSFAATFGTRLAVSTARQDRNNLARIDAYYLRSDRAFKAFLMHGARGRLAWRRTLRAVRQHIFLGPSIEGVARC